MKGNLFKMNNLINYFLGLPKSIYFCFKYLPIKIAVKIPIFLSKNVYLSSVKGDIDIETDKIKTGMIKIRFGGVGIFDKKYSRTIWQNNGGKVVFRGITNIGHGSRISVNQNATLIFGKNFCITAESQVICSKKISFGNDVLISWQCLFMDTDFHKIYKNNMIKNENKAIEIGNHVWIGCRNTILKGVNIADNCVIAANSNVVKSIEQKNSIIAGNPAKMIENNIQWKQ